VKPPRFIHVGPYEYSVHTDAAAVAELDSGDDGSCDFHDVRITVNPARPEQVQRDTLLHEVLHAIGALTGLRRDLGEEAEERVVERLSSNLLDTLRRNPELVEYLLS
jgi:hypothetical protein